MVKPLFLVVSLALSTASAAPAFSRLQFHHRFNPEYIPVPANSQNDNKPQNSNPSHDNDNVIIPKQHELLYPRKIPYAFPPHTPHGIPSPSDMPTYCCDEPDMKEQDNDHLRDDGCAPDHRRPIQYCQMSLPDFCNKAPSSVRIGHYGCPTFTTPEASPGRLPGINKKEKRDREEGSKERHEQVWKDGEPEPDWHKFGKPEQPQHLEWKFAYNDEYNTHWVDGMGERGNDCCDIPAFPTEENDNKFVDGCAPSHRRSYEWCNLSVEEYCKTAPREITKHHTGCAPENGDVEPPRKSYADIVGTVIGTRIGKRDAPPLSKRGEWDDKVERWMRKWTHAKEGEFPHWLKYAFDNYPFGEDSQEHMVRWKPKDPIVHHHDKVNQDEAEEAERRKKGVHLVAEVTDPTATRTPMPRVGPPKESRPEIESRSLDKLETEDGSPIKEVEGGENIPVVPFNGQMRKQVEEKLAERGLGWDDIANWWNDFKDWFKDKTGHILSCNSWEDVIELQSTANDDDSRNPISKRSCSEELSTYHAATTITTTTSSPALGKRSSTGSPFLDWLEDKFENNWDYYWNKWGPCGHEACGDPEDIDRKLVRRDDQARADRRAWFASKLDPAGRNRVWYKYPTHDTPEKRGSMATKGGPPGGGGKGSDEYFKMITYHDTFGKRADVALKVGHTDKYVPSVHPDVPEPVQGHEKRATVALKPTIIARPGESKSQKQRYSQRIFKIGNRECWYTRMSYREPRYALICGPDPSAPIEQAKENEDKEWNALQQTNLIPGSRPIQRNGDMLGVHDPEDEKHEIAVWGPPGLPPHHQHKYILVQHPTPNTTEELSDSLDKRSHPKYESLRFVDVDSLDTLGQGADENSLPSQPDLFQLGPRSENQNEKREVVSIEDAPSIITEFSAQEQPQSGELEEQQASPSKLLPHILGPGPVIPSKDDGNQVPPLEPIAEAMGTGPVWPGLPLVPPLPKPKKHKGPGNWMRRKPTGSEN